MIGWGDRTVTTRLMSPAFMSYASEGHYNSKVDRHIFNRPDRRRLGTVGLPLPGIGARLDEDGEILISGATVFAGYLGDAEATSAVGDATGCRRRT